jgi:hypothetical protein
MKLSRLFAVPAFAGAMLLAQLTGPTPAHAAIHDLACHYDYVHYNVCLHFTDLPDDPNNYVIAHVGMDLSMSQQYAQDLIDHGAPAQALLYSGNGRYLGSLTMSPGWPAAGGSGYGVELTGEFYRGTLDAAVGDDAIHANVLYWNYHVGAWIGPPMGAPNDTYSGTVHGDFAIIGGGGGGGGCLIQCQ